MANAESKGRVYCATDVGCDDANLDNIAEERRRQKYE